MSWTRVLSIDDPAARQNAFVNSDFRALPKKKGAFLMKVTQLGMNRVWITRYSLSLPQLNAFTINPERTAIGFLTDSGSSLRYCGANILPGDIIINRAGAEGHQLTDTALHSGMISLAIDDLDTALEAVVGCNFTHKLEKPFIRADPALMSRLLNLHKAVGRLARDTPEILELPEVCRALEEQLIHLMVRCLAEGVGIEITTGARRHDRIIVRFEEFLTAHPDRPLYLTEICAGIGVAERTLRAACEDHLGMGPIRYLALRRMHLVRRALQHADPSRSTVTHIVTDHGFWELGRFSVAYRTLFGESPSETLRRPAERLEADPHRPFSIPTSRNRGQTDGVSGGHQCQHRLPTIAIKPVPAKVEEPPNKSHRATRIA
jgi:AraC-like DNA-binding protein